VRHGTHGGQVALPSPGAAAATTHPENRRSDGGGGASPLIWIASGRVQLLDCTYSVTEAIVIGVIGMWSLPTSTA